MEMNIPMTNVAVDNDNTWIYQLDKNLEDNDAWINRLNKRVEETEWQDPDCTIFRVPCMLRVVDPISYEPRILSLGPYHHGKPHLRAMEELKWRYLKIFLNRNPERGLEHYINLVAAMETRTREAYSEAPHMDSKHWVEMMLLDGCFVVEFFQDQTQPIKNSGCIYSAVLRDMLLLENQLPFIVLAELCKLNPFYGQNSCLLAQTTLHRFTATMPENIRLSSHLSIDDIDHILHLLYSCMLPECCCDSPSMRGFSIVHWLWKKLWEKLRLDRLRMRRFSIVHRQWKKLSPERCLDRLRMRRFPIVHRLWKKLWEKLWKFKGINQSSFIWVPSAKNLKDAFVVFQKKTNTTSFMDITFQRGTLEIPRLEIYDPTNSVFRNLIALEQCRMGYSWPTHLTAYANLMDCIITTSADVDILQQDGIIVSLVGNDDDIARLFNQLCKNVAVDDNHYLVGVFTEILGHCNKRENKWKASLNHNYFNNPWATVSFIAAIFLFLFTITQTVLALFSYLWPRLP